MKMEIQVNTNNLCDNNLRKMIPRYQKAISQSIYTKWKQYFSRFLTGNTPE